MPLSIRIVKTLLLRINYCANILNNVLTLYTHTGGAIGNAVKGLKCVMCGKEYDADYTTYLCSACGSVLDVLLDIEVIKNRVSDLRRLQGRGVWRYKPFLPPVRNIISLDEGDTPLIKLNSVGRQCYAKFEGANPTGSFKDRGMTIIVSIASTLSSKALVTASTGNTASSAAAYAARAGLPIILVLPKGKVAEGKLAQAILYGARIVEIEGSFDDALSAVMDACNKNKQLYPLNSFNPWRLEGQKTIAFEIVERISVPDWVIVPVGNAGNISAIWKGFKELYEAGIIAQLPRMVGVQASGAAPLATAFEKGLDRPVFVDNPETIATAIRIGKPVNWPKALRAVKESKGMFIKVTDDEIALAHRELARREGIGAEPAGAAAYAGLKKLIENGVIDSSDKAVIVVTGHALKDPQAALMHSATRCTVKSVSEAISKIFELSEISPHLT